MIIPYTITESLKRILLTLGRGLEYIATGQSDYNLYSHRGVLYETVNDTYKAKEILAEMKEYLRDNFGLVIEAPIIIELYSGNEFSLKGKRRKTKGVLGQYHYENLPGKYMAHMIYISTGLEKRRFRAILAHEMTHAFLREAQLMNCDRYLREGFARWIEYKILLEMGLEKEAEKILDIKTWKYGKAVEKIFRLEKKVGTKGVIEVLKRID